MPGCRQNYVPLGSQSQPTATHALVELLVARALPAKNKVLTSGAHPGTPINVMKARVGEHPEQPNALNRLLTRRLGQLIYFKIPPQPKWRWRRMGYGRSSPG